MGGKRTFASRLVGLPDYQFLVRGDEVCILWDTGQGLKANLSSARELNLHRIVRVLNGADGRTNKFNKPGLQTALR